MHFRYPTTNEKPGDSFKRQQESWRRAYAQAFVLRERFPKVEQLVVDMTFTDVRKMGTYSAQMHSFCTSAKAFFAVACPRTLCLDGGFDLDSLVLDLLGAHNTTATGTLECRGWIDPARSEQARCLLQMHYRLQVQYEPSEPSASKRRGYV